MAVGASAYLINNFLDAAFNADAFSIAGGAFVQLHVGDPGASGTSNQAGNATRKAVSFSAASGGAVSNDAEILWSTGEVDTAEDYTHLSFWDDVDVGEGNFLGSGLMTANAVAVGDEFKIPVGDLNVSFAVAS